MHPAAVLDCCYVKDDVHFVTGCLDKRVRLFQLGHEQETVLGSHNDAVRCVSVNSDHSLVCSASWDATVRIYDIQSSNAQIAQLELPEKAFVQDTIGNRLVVGLAKRIILVYDLRNLSKPEQTRESTLKYQTRSLACMLNGQGFVSGSIEGRVAVDYFDENPTIQAKKYAFKCHRLQLEGQDTAYPVNAIAFHPKHHTFASAGADGIVNIWDGMHKKRVKQYARYPTSIASVAFNSDGRYMALASSYTFEEGEKDAPPDAIFVKTLNDADVKPKK